MADPATIFIAMPLFEGWEHVGHTLETIRTQTYRNYRVLISVDGGDRRSHAACQPFLSDRRFTIVVHEDRLHWEGNINYLASQLNEDFFCYWQHDDYCDPTYLEKLVVHAVRHPEASAVHCDMELFGELDLIERPRSVTGFALQRVIRQFESPSVGAMRGLIRADALRASLPIKLASVWLMALARAGEFHRIPELLYHRRIRSEALEFSMPRRPPAEKWRASLDWGLGALENVFPLIEAGERTKLFAVVVNAIMNDRYCGKLKYTFTGTRYELRLKFVRQFLDEAERKFGWRPYDDPATPHRRKAGSEELRPGEEFVIDALLADTFVGDDAIVLEYAAPTPDRRTRAPGRRSIGALARLFGR